MTGQPAPNRISAQLPLSLARKLRMGLNWWYVGPRNGYVSLFSRNAFALAWRRHGYQTASFNDNLHFAFRNLPEFARHLLKDAPSVAAS